MTQTVTLQELKKTAKLPAKQAGIGSVKKFFDSQKSVLAAVLPKHVNAERMLKIALGALRTTPKLMECTTETLFGAIVQCSQLGLEPNTPLGHAYLIPFRNNRKDVTEVQIVFGYKGLIDLARRSGQIISISAHAVHDNDAFNYAYGLEERLEHVPAAGDRGPVTHFYAVAKLSGGGHAFEVMSVAEIEAIRDASSNFKFARDKGATVWGQHFIQMGRKTVLRRLFNYLPVSIELATAAALDGQASQGESQNIGAVLEGDFNLVDDEQRQYAEPQEEHDGPSELFHDALHAAQSGDRTMALDLCRHLTDAECNTVMGAFSAHQSNREESESSTRRARTNARANVMSME